ncbi:hypothetical protein [Streptomyces sp. TLI_105]|uniref:hypothetical protein n=1 Tax=Streptomyces sp. TLI_105 TaxID=1881019 RepID=UPI0008992EBA|nr:hypothetical protein [Streptomyces sp. TLI_105]SEB91661.1 hypothetical protein SAMN05428939_1082 [Streptomyces sp. TLI_105]
MRNPAWRVALGVVVSSAFFWAVAGAVDLGPERNRKGYALPDGGGWYTLALFAGFTVAYFSVASLTDTTAGRNAALVPAAGACFGVVSCLLMGQQARHRVAAAVMALIASALPPVVHLRNRARRARLGANTP